MNNENKTIIRHLLNLIINPNDQSNIQQLTQILHNKEEYTTITSLLDSLDSKPDEFIKKVTVTVQKYKDNEEILLYTMLIDLAYRLKSYAPFEEITYNMTTTALKVASNLDQKLTARIINRIIRDDYFQTQLQYVNFLAEYGDKKTALSILLNLIKFFGETNAHEYYKEKYSILLGTLGNVLYEYDAEKAATAYEKALEIQRGLLAQDPQNSTYLADVAMTCNNLGTLMIRMGRFENSEQFYREALELIEKVPLKNTSHLLD